MFMRRCSVHHLVLAWNLFGILKLAGDRRCHNFAKKTLVIESGVIKGVRVTAAFTSSVCVVAVACCLAAITTKP